MTYSCGIFPELDADIRSLASSTSSSGSPGRSPSPHTGSSTPSTLAGSDVGDLLKGIQTNAFNLFTHEGHHHHLPVEGESQLEESQMRKLRHIIRKADIRPGHRVRT